MSLKSGVRTDVPHTDRSGVDFIYLKVLSGGPVNIYKGVSPEYWKFSETYMVFDNLSSGKLSLKSESDTELELYLAWA